MSIKDDIGLRIKQARTTRKVKQKVIANHLGISAAAVSKWEAEDSDQLPTVDKLAKIADLLDVSFEWLATGKGEMMPSIVPQPPFEIGAYEIDYVATGRRLKKIRGDANQQEFSDVLGIGKASVARYELGHGLPDAELLLKIYCLYNVDPLWLLTGKVMSVDHLNEMEKQVLSQFRTSTPEIQNAALKVISKDVVKDSEHD